MKSIYLFACIIFTFHEPAKSQFMNDSLRSNDSKFTTFFHEKLDSWYNQNIFDLKTKMSSAEKEILNDFIHSDHDLGKKIGPSFLRSFSYSVKFLNSPKKEKVYSLSLLNINKNIQLDKKIKNYISSKNKHILAEIPANAILGLKFSTQPSAPTHLLIFTENLNAQNQNKLIPESLKGSLSGPGLVEISMATAGKAEFALQLNVQTQENCLGQSDQLQKDFLISKDGKKTLLCHLKNINADAFSDEIEKTISKVFAGLNLKPGLLGIESHLSTEISWP